jgi:hypothetical protein
MPNPNVDRASAPKPKAKKRSTKKGAKKGAKKK